MPRTYQKGNDKARPGEYAGCECETVGCTSVTSSSWSNGVCASCRSKSARKRKTLGVVQIETVLQRSNFAAAAAAMASGMPLLTPLPTMVHMPAMAVPMPTAIAPQVEEAQPNPQALVEAEQRAAKSEARAAAADKRAADATAKLNRVLLTIADRLFAELGGETDEGVPARRFRRWTGLSCEELQPHHNAMKVIDLMRGWADDRVSYIRDDDWP